jgi:autotransporter family porin
MNHRHQHPGELRLVARAAAAVVTALLSAHAVAGPCGPNDTLVVSANESTTVSTSCPNESVTVNAVIDVSQGTGLTNGDSLGSVLIAGTVRGLNPIVFSNTTMSGSFTNNGAIASYWNGSGSGFGGPALEFAFVSLSGSILNTGTISGDYSGIFLNSGSTVSLLRNTGAISSLVTAIGIDGSGTSVGEIRNEAGGTLHGNNSDAIRVGNSAVVGQIVNHGQMTSFSSGVLVFGGAQVMKIENAVDGVVAAPTAIEVNFNGSVVDIDNAGRLTGSDIGVRVYAGALTGALTNRASGVITGSSGAGVLMSGGAFGPTGLREIINQGLIEGSVGIDGFEGSVISHGVTNSGTIHGDAEGIRLSQGSSLAGGIVNSGVIRGANHAIYIEGGSALDRIDLVGTSAALQGDVYAPDTALNVKTGAVFTTTNAFNLQSFNVESGARLVLTAAPHTTSGLGTNGVTVSQGFRNDGTVAVGATTVGQINGAYTQSSGAALQVGVNGAATYGKLAVSGDVTLSGGTGLNVLVGSGATFSAGDRLQGVVTSGGVLGVSVAPGSGLAITDNNLFYDFVADNTRVASELDLLIQPAAAPFTRLLGGSRPSLQGVAGSLDQMLVGGVPAAMQPLFDQLGALSQDQIRSSLGQLTPVMMGAGSQAGVNALRSMNKIIQSRVESNQGLSAGNEPAEKFMWVRGFGGVGDQRNQGDVAGFDSRSRGLVIGADAPMSDKLRAGLAFTYAKTGIDDKSAERTSRLDVNTYELVGYGSWNLNPVTDVNYQVDVGWNRVDGTRKIALLNTQARSSFDSLALHGSVGIGRTWPVSAQTSVTPSLRADYTRMKTDGYTESGAGAFNLKVDDSTFQEFMITGDFKGSHLLSERTKLVGNVSAGYDLLNKQVTTASSFVGGGPVFETRGLVSSPWLYRAGIGLLHDGAGGLEYSLRYDAEKRTSGYFNQTLSARLRWAF